MDDDFTNADFLELSQLKQGKSQLGQSVINGEITPQQHDELLGQIAPRIQMLAAKQQQTQQKQMQQQQQMLMHQNAQARAMKQKDDEHEAQSFQNRVAVYTDPLTGHTAHLYKGDKGEWKEVTFDHAEKMKGGGNG